MHKTAHHKNFGRSEPYLGIRRQQLIGMHFYESTASTVGFHLFVFCFILC